MNNLDWGVEYAWLKKRKGQRIFWFRGDVINTMDWVIFRN